MWESGFGWETTSQGVESLVNGTQALFYKFHFLVRMREERNSEGVDGMVKTQTKK